MNSRLTLAFGLSLFTLHLLANSPITGLEGKDLKCISLNTPLNLGDNQGYTAADFRSLRNSIFAQHGFKFEDKEVNDEMAKRGCLKPEVVYTPDKLTSIDKKNVALLKQWETQALETDPAAQFEHDWKKSHLSPRARALLISQHYCYLSETDGKKIGIIYFDYKSRAKTQNLRAMMNLSMPTWAKGLDKSERASMKTMVSQGTADTTSMYSLELKTKGNWIVSDSGSTDSGSVKITLETENKKMILSKIKISAENIASSGMLSCQLE